MSCPYCHKELVSELAYEDGIYRALIAWLNEITCIKWYRVFPEFRRPDEDTDEQYGMIFIQSYDKLITPDSSMKLMTKDSDGADMDPSYCLAIDTSFNFTFELTVFRESGEIIRTKQEGVDQVSRSASDVLKNVNILLSVPEFARKLPDGITVVPAGTINVNVEKRESVWEWQADAIYESTVCLKTSYPVDDIFYCVQRCDGEIICQKEVCE